MSIWRSHWTDLPVSVRVGVTVVLFGLAVSACAIPLMAQAAESPVRVENLVVGYTGLIALLGMAAQWGALFVERSYQRAQIAELKHALGKKLDTERVTAIMRELDQTRSEIRSLNERLDRFLEPRAE